MTSDRLSVSRSGPMAPPSARPLPGRLAAVMATTVALALTPGPAVPWPPSAAWIDAVGAPTAFIAAVRSVAVVAGAYLTTVGVLARLLVLVRRRSVATRVAAGLPPWLRSVALGSVGIVASVAPAAAVGPSTGHAPTPAHIASTAEPVGPNDVGPNDVGPDDGVPNDVGPDDGVPDDVGAPEVAVVSMMPEPLIVLHPGPSADTWTVAPGEHFWSIAEQVLLDETGRTVTAREVARYWVRLVDANRARLAVPGEPDVVFPGQELVLPPVER